MCRCASAGGSQSPAGATCQPNGENDIIQTMKNGGKNSLSLMAVMLCGMGLCATSDDVAARLFDGFPIEARGLFRFVVNSL